MVDEPLLGVLWGVNAAGAAMETPNGPHPALLLADRARLQDERSTMMEQEIDTTKKQIGHIRDEIASLVTLLRAHVPAPLSTTVQHS